MLNFEIDADQECPVCGKSPTRHRVCTEPGCRRGWLEPQYDDAYMIDPDRSTPCLVCQGSGVIRWCSSCGADLTGLATLTVRGELVEEADSRGDTLFLAITAIIAVAVVIAVLALVFYKG